MIPADGLPAGGFAEIERRCIGQAVRHEALLPVNSDGIRKRQRPNRSRGQRGADGDRRRDGSRMCQEKERAEDEDRLENRIKDTQDEGGQTFIERARASRAQATCREEESSRESIEASKADMVSQQAGGGLRATDWTSQVPSIFDRRN